MIVRHLSDSKSKRSKNKDLNEFYFRDQSRSIVGKRSVLSYMLSPVARSVSEAGRER